MYKITQNILTVAANRKLADTEGKSLNWYVFDQYGLEMGFSSSDCLSLSIKAELEALCLFDWRK